jgi:hypothetical protein
MEYSSIEENKYSILGLARELAPGVFHMRVYAPGSAGAEEDYFPSRQPPMLDSSTESDRLTTRFAQPLSRQVIS